MGEFFYEYSLFTAKVITSIIIVLIALIGFLAILGARARLKKLAKDRESIEIEKINEKFDSLRDALESEILSKDEHKQLLKERKKQEKAEERSQKQQLKKNKNEIADAQTPNARKRMYVLRFIGDLYASEVENLRSAITAILMVAKSDEEVLVILDSPGGIVHDYGLAASQLKRIRDNGNTLVVAVDLVAASGGYLMSAVANKIIAAPFAVLGSIGVLAQVPNFNRLLEKHNIDIEQHTAGEFKTTLTLLGKNTDKARQKFREELEDTHVLFKKFVSENRPQLDIEKLATGEHWYGSQALELKLIDEITTSDDYLLKKSKDTDIYEVTYVIEENLSEKISNFLQGFSTKLLKTISTWFHRSAKGI